MKNKTIGKAEHSILSAASYTKDLLSVSAPGGVAGKGVELGMGAMLAKTALKRLPVPFNFLAPIIVEKVILKHGVEEGREILLKGLKWIKNATEETEDKVMAQKSTVNL
ncbi:hypothetical protein SAMN04487995_1303 [Dyadobacter koreensis]|uniref:Uncharacterized protein n=1 Tax=Dyadobacter koreensis TaxID=408657 RepID=A0A1H6RGP4_9BACT|nr:hypothetical protein [Dyadobacter koreensis]SEI54981.1 hypothetical protein SAMN04487995_1303 [Dyadobacter koreensis]